MLVGIGAGTLELSFSTPTQGLTWATLRGVRYKRWLPSASASLLRWGACGTHATRW